MTETINDATIDSFDFGAGNFGASFTGIQSAGATITYGAALAAYDFITENSVAITPVDTQIKELVSSGSFISFEFNFAPTGFILPAGKKYYLGFDVLELTGSIGLPIEMFAPQGCGQSEFGNAGAGIVSIGSIDPGMRATPGMQILFTINGISLDSGAHVCSGVKSGQVKAHRYTTITIRDHNITLDFNDELANGTCDVQVTGVDTPIGVSGFSGIWNFGDGSSNIPDSSSATLNHTYTQAGLYTVSFVGTDANGVEYISELELSCGPQITCDYNIDQGRSSGIVSGESKHFIKGTNAMKVGFNDATTPSLNEDDISLWYKKFGAGANILFSNELNPDHVFDGLNPNKGSIVSPEIKTNTTN